MNLSLMIFEILHRFVVFCTIAALVLHRSMRLQRLDMYVLILVNVVVNVSHLSQSNSRYVDLAMFRLSAASVAQLFNHYF